MYSCLGIIHLENIRSQKANSVSLHQLLPLPIWFHIWFWLCVYGNLIRDQPRFVLFLTAYLPPTQLKSGLNQQKFSTLYCPSLPPPNRIPFMPFNVEPWKCSHNFSFDLPHSLPQSIWPGNSAYDLRHSSSVAIHRRIACTETRGSLGLGFYLAPAAPPILPFPAALPQNNSGGCGGNIELMAKDDEQKC